MSVKQVYNAKKNCDNAYSKYYDMKKQLWKVVNDTYKGKYVLAKADEKYVGVVYICECKKNYGIRGKILWEDGVIDTWIVVNIDGILEDYELCSIDKAMNVFSSIADIEEILKYKLVD